MIIFKGKDNSVAIMELAPGANRTDAVEKFIAGHGGFYKEIGDDLELPKSREYRDAWVIKRNKIVIDKKKADEIDAKKEKLVKLEELEAEIKKIKSKIG